MGRVTTRVRVRRISGSVARDRMDTLVVEEPLEMRLGGQVLTVTMRTPGHDFEMVTGFLIGEGVIADASDIHSLRYCAGATEDGVNTYNVIDVVLAPGVPEPNVAAARNFTTTSSCGVCGKTSLEAVRTKSRFVVADDRVCFSTAVLSALPDRLREAQKVFARTGGLHAAALVTPGGEPPEPLDSERMQLEGTSVKLSNRSTFTILLIVAYQHHSLIHQWIHGLTTDQQGALRLQEHPRDMTQGGWRHIGSSKLYLPFHR